LRSLLTQGELPETASLLLEETAVLYKEKINYKAPGGAGYSPHQDAPAYRFIDTHVSCMLAIDDSRESNGCLEVVSSMHQELLPTDEKGCVRSDIVEQLEWNSVPIWAGQALWFHSRTPHRSQANQSTQSRRALYPTYNALSEGDLREAYYEQKAREFASIDGPRVSLIGDFEGQML
jgi:ectoine hydroxylase-related dioxygenase (phytanoyl-CoA dioxygenase family)